MSRFFAGKAGISFLLAVFLGLALSACSSGVSQSRLDDANRQLAEGNQQQQRMEQQRTAAQNAINSARMLVDALTENSTDAQVQAARAAVTAAANAIAAATSLSDVEREGLTRLLNAIQSNLAEIGGQRDTLEQRRAAQRTAAQNAIDSARNLVNGLTNGSTAAQVQAAAAAVDAAAAAIAAATSLTQEERDRLSGQLGSIRDTQRDRLRNRQMALQRMAAENALNRARMAVDAVTPDSSDQTVQDADDAVDDAGDAVGDATSLSDTERQELADRLATIRRDLAAAKYRRQVAMENQGRQEQDDDKERQRQAAQDALNAAERAVNGLPVDHTDTQQSAAGDLITAAANAIAAATSLSPIELQGLNARLRLIRQNFARLQMQRNDLIAARNAANTAATGADDAADDAEDDADDADDAVMNFATLQTAELQEEHARHHAAEARKHATTARGYATTAMTEKTNADNATTVAAAQAAQRAAEAAKRKADEYRTKAMEELDKAVAAAAKALMVDGINYSVGDSTVVNNGRTRTTGSGATGRLPGNAGRIIATSVAIPGGVPTSTARYRQAVAARTGVIGSISDSTDDRARLTLIDKYMGSDERKVAVDDGNRPDAPATVSSTSGPLGALAPPSAAWTVSQQPTPFGMFVILTEGQTGGSANTLESTDLLSANAEPQQIYSYTLSPTGAGSPLTLYVRQKTVTRNATTGDVQTISYQHVELRTDHDGDGATAKRQVTARVPKAVAYDHVTFGAWADLNKVGGNDQAPGSLGIGFVQKTAKGKRTGNDMPNFGAANYLGNYVANVRAAATSGNGSFRTVVGPAALTANFATAGVTATLSHLATLTGSIEDDGFSGTTAAPHAVAGWTAASYLPATGSYTGSFKGHFYGPKAVEAAGVFDFTSTGRRAGEFRGAFGVSASPDAFRQNGQGAPPARAPVTETSN